MKGADVVLPHPSAPFLAFAVCRRGRPAPGRVPPRSGMVLSRQLRSASAGSGFPNHASSVNLSAPPASALPEASPKPGRVHALRGGPLLADDLSSCVVGELPAAAPHLIS